MKTAQKVLLNHLEMHNKFRGVNLGDIAYFFPVYINKVELLGLKSMASRFVSAIQYG